MTLKAITGGETDYDIMEGHNEQNDKRKIGQAMEWIDSGAKWSVMELFNINSLKEEVIERTD